MKRLYHYLVGRWGEPSDLIVFDGARATRPGTLEVVHIAVWMPGEDCDVATFFSLGMSEAVMAGGNYRAELTLGRRGHLTPDLKGSLARFIANLAEYPFMYNLTLGWWERLADPGPIPGFPGCSQLLLAPDLGTGDELRFDRFPLPDEDVQVLRAIPITPHENHLLKDYGRTAFLDYWEESGVDIWGPRGSQDGV
jgi:hypothetical protein